MEIVITQGTYRWRAVEVVPGQLLPFLCEEFANVGLETERRMNYYVASKEQVLATAQKILA